MGLRVDPAPMKTHHRLSRANELLREYRLANGNCASDPSTTPLLDQAIALIEEAAKAPDEPERQFKILEAAVRVTVLISKCEGIGDLVRELIRQILG